MSRFHISQSYPYSGSSGSCQIRYSANHGTSSNFSSSANANEDWTKISDLAERRKIQNRIAQRNYRKRLKRRMEDLERRAASSSAPPEQSHSELADSSAQADDSDQSQRSSKQCRSESSDCGQLDCRLSPELIPDHSLFDATYNRSLSTTPRPTFSYTYPPYDLNTSLVYSQSSYQDMPAYNTGYATNYAYQPTSSNSMPTMLPTPTLKRENMLSDEDFLSPFSMTYASMAGINVSARHGNLDYNAQVNSTAFLDPSMMYSSQQPPNSNGYKMFLEAPVSAGQTLFRDSSPKT